MPPRLPLRTLARIKRPVRTVNAIRRTAATGHAKEIAPVAKEGHNRNMNFLKSSVFLKWFSAVFVLCCLFFAWELGAFREMVWSLPRPEPTQTEILYTGLIIILISFASGLAGFRMKQGTCPIGARNASAMAGALGVVTLLCPVCLLLPFSLFGLSMSLALLSPYLPLLRVITLVLLGVSVILLWPKQR